MRLSKPLLTLALSGCMLFSMQYSGPPWFRENHKAFNLVYTTKDERGKKEYVAITKKGIVTVKKFFGSSFSKKFDLFIHPDRHSLDSTWQKDWSIPGFRSECWMVASGVAARLDLLSPSVWATQACEHVYNETEKTQRLVTHELVHVFHGQQNTSPDFSNTEGIDWFVEGLATYASGQCDTARLSEIKKAVVTGKIPGSLDKFWTGKLKYGLAGSVVMYIDYKYGRAKLKELLPLNKKSEILDSLNTTETELLTGWRKYLENI